MTMMYITAQLLCIQLRESGATLVLVRGAPRLRAAALVAYMDVQA